MISLKKVLIQILNKISDLSLDYVIEEGVNGDWTYRKWNSGMAECWYDHSYGTISLTSNMSSGVVYSNSTWAGNYINLPSGLFASTSNNVAFSIVETNGYTITQVSEIFADRVRVRVWGSYSQSPSLRVKLIVKGTWK